MKLILLILLHDMLEEDSDDNLKIGNYYLEVTLQYQLEPNNTNIVRQEPTIKQHNSLSMVAS